jgi:hypothetical protein
MSLFLERDEAERERPAVREVSAGLRQEPAAVFTVSDVGDGGRVLAQVGGVDAGGLFYVRRRFYSSCHSSDSSAKCLFSRI